MGLDDLKRRMYRPEDPAPERKKETKLEKHFEKVSTSWEHPEELIPPEVIMGKKKTKKIIWWGIGGGLVVIGVIFIGLTIFNGGFNIGSNTSNKIDIQIQGGEEVSSGKKITWKVRYRNDNSIRLQDVALVFEFPPNAQSLVGEFSNTGLKRERRDLEDLDPGEEGEEIFSAILFGPKGDELGGLATLEYRPEGSSARFSKEMTYRSKITSTVLGIELETPEEFRSGQEAEIVLRVVSNADSVFRGLSVGVEYPAAFKYIQSDPSPKRGDALWEIGDLPAGGEFSIKIKGKIEEATNDQVFRVTVGLYDDIKNSFAAFNTHTESFRVSQSLLVVSLSVANGELAPNVTAENTSVDVNVRWQNNLPVPVENISVEVMLQGEALDLKELEADSGEFNASTNSVQWVPGRIRQLSLVNPGEGGLFKFRVRLKNNLITGVDPVVKFRGRISSALPPSGYQGIDISSETTKELKITSRLSFVQNGYYYNSRITNTGPLPPRVGQETTYVIVWSLLSTLNDLENATVKATLPSYVSWKNVMIPSTDQSLIFNSQTRELTWSPGSIEAGTGYKSPAREIAFQVGIIPSLPQVGESPELVSKAVLTTKDSFTQYAYTREADRITTNIRNDSQGNLQQGVVQE